MSAPTRPGVGLRRYYRLSLHTLDDTPPRERAAILGALDGRVQAAFSQRRNRYLAELAPQYEEDLRALSRDTGISQTPLRQYLTQGRQEGPPVEELSPLVVVDWAALDLHRPVPRQHLELSRLIARTVRSEVATSYRGWIAELVRSSTQARTARMTGLSVSRVSEILSRYQVHQSRDAKALGSA